MSHDKDHKVAGPDLQHRRHQAADGQVHLDDACRSPG